MDNKEIKISVIIPVYNTEKHLHKAVDSVLNQSLKQLEIFLVDDGSTDSSALICDEYQKIDSRVIVIHKKNEGQAKARNDAINKAKR